MSSANGVMGRQRRDGGSAGALSLCSKACLNSFWPEHKRIYQKRRAAGGADALADQLEGLKLEQRSLWLMIPEPKQGTIAKYMDMKSLCRTDSVMTRAEEKKVL